MQSFLIIAGVSALVTTCFGGRTAFDRTKYGFYIHAIFQIGIGLAAAVIVARSDNILTNRFDWDNEGKLLVLGAMAAGIIVSVLVITGIEWLVEEHQRRKLFEQTKRPPFPTPSVKVAKQIVTQDPRISRTCHRRVLDTAA